MAQHTAVQAEDRFGWWMTGAHLWVLIGLFLDGWHHRNDPGLETFFTPWHGILYSGIAVATAIIAERARRGRRSGLSRRQAIPAGYGLSVIGGAIFVGGAVADMLWHEILGIEVGVEALLSPTHLTLAVAGALVVAGPLRAAWSAPRDASVVAPWPALVAVGAFVALLGFFTQYVHPFVQLYPTLDGAEASTDLYHAAGIAGIIVTAAILSASVLAPALRWRLPAGAVVVILGMPMLFVATQEGTYELLPALLVAAIAADVLVRWRPPSRREPANLRLVATAVPALVFTGYFLTLAVMGTLVWSVHLVTGGIAVAAGAGMLLALLLLVPENGDAGLAATPPSAARQTAAAGRR